MKLNRWPTLIIVSLVAVSFLAVRSFQRTSSAQVDNHSLASGMGDLGYYEAQQIFPNTGAVASESTANTGMVDLDVAERERADEEARALGQREQARINSENSKLAGERSSGVYNGMGDQHQAKRETGPILDSQALSGGLVPKGDPANSPEDSSGIYNGMGDLRRVDR